MAKEIGKRTSKIVEEAVKRARPQRAKGKLPMDTLSNKEIKTLQKEAENAIKAAEDVIDAMKLAEEVGLDINMDTTMVKDAFKEKVKGLKRQLKILKKAKPSH